MAAADSNLCFEAVVADCKIRRLTFLDVLFLDHNYLRHSVVR
jgi:hypothetical protein